MLPYLLTSLLLLTLAAPRVDVHVVSSTAGGEMYVAVYDSQESFDEQATLVGVTKKLSDSAVRADLNIDLPAGGQYIFAAFQDLNGNGELDRNFIGVPTEPYGFAKPAPSKWRAPEFGEIASRISGDERIKIEVRNWSEH